MTPRRSTLLRAILVLMVPLWAAAGALADGISAEPSSLQLVLPAGTTITRTITVHVPAGAAASRVDVYLLADATFSMASVIEALQNGSDQIVDAVMAEWPNVDLAFGVGSYRDFGEYAAFDHQLAPTDDSAAVRAAIDTWTAVGGGDLAEAQFYALDRLAADVDPAGGTIGWRSGAKRVIVWFGDAPGHDPICRAISELSYDIDEGQVRAALQAADITVLAVSAGQTALGHSNSGTPINDDWQYLDSDPIPCSAYYQGICPIDGASGQATRIAGATGGLHIQGISADTIVSTIRDIISGQIATISIAVLALQATGDTAQSVTAISPASYGPLDSTSAHDLPFRVTFLGPVPCQSNTQTLNGGLAVMVDNAEAEQVSVSVQVQVPPCDQITPPTEEIPEPATWLLLGSGLTTMVALARRRHRSR